MPPTHPIAVAYLTRAAWLWFCVRAFATLALILANADPLRAPLAASFFIVLTTVSLGLLDAHLRNEWALLGNFAVSPGRLALYLATPAVIGETIIGIVGVLAT